MPSSTSSQWRQVRLFTTATGRSTLWYFDLLEDVVKPWLKKKPSVKFYFSRYMVKVGSDEADTDASSRPAKFVEDVQGYGPCHRSIRIRFEANSEIENELESLIKTVGDQLWYSSFLDYEIGNDLGGDRFSIFPTSEPSQRLDRGLLVASVLQANCTLLLRLFNRTSASYRWERNAHGLNEGFGNPLQSVAHMLKNTWWVDDGGPFKLQVENYARAPGHVLSGPI